MKVGENLLNGFIAGLRSLKLASACLTSVNAGVEWGYCNRISTTISDILCLWNVHLCHQYDKLFETEGYQNSAEA